MINDNKDNLKDNQEQEIENQIEESTVEENSENTATNDIVVMILKDMPGSITKFPEFSKPTETPYPCKQAIKTVPYLVIWVIFFLPISPCSFKFLK